MKETISSLLLLIIGVSYVSCQQCHMREVDLCMAAGMFQYQTSGMPDDDEKITEWCETLEEIQDCAGNFSTKCMTPMQRELGQLFLGGASEAGKELCTPGSELRNNFLKHAPCIAEGAGSDEFKSIVRDIQVVIEKTFEVQFKDRLPTLCCGFIRFLEGTGENTKRMCGDEAVKMLNFIMDMIVTQLPKTVCQTYDHKSDTCLQLLPVSGTPPKGTESSSQIVKLMNSFFETAI